VTRKKKHLVVGIHGDLKTRFLAYFYTRTSMAAGAMAERLHPGLVVVAILRLQNGKIIVEEP
jgi:hypothetical protein